MKYVHRILLIVWLAVIFIFSAKPADESAKMSMGVGRLVAGIFVPGFEDWTESEQIAFAEKIDYPVRKCAHATEYAIAAVLFTFFYTDFDKTKDKRYWLAFVCTVLYAVSDEIHQLFVAGRSCQFTDVLIDSSGALIGVLFIIIVTRLIVMIKALDEKI